MENQYAGLTIYRMVVLWMPQDSLLGAEREPTSVPIVARWDTRFKIAKQRLGRRHPTDLRMQMEITLTVVDSMRLLHLTMRFEMTHTKMKVSPTMNNQVPQGTNLLLWSYKILPPLSTELVLVSHH